MTRNWPAQEHGARVVEDAVDGDVPCATGAVYFSVDWLAKIGLQADIIVIVSIQLSKMPSSSR